MAITDAMKAIQKKFHYKITGTYWSRLGVMCKRYSEETVIEALNGIEEDDIPLSQCLSRIENKCQNIINKEEINSDIFDML